MKLVLDSSVAGFLLQRIPNPAEAQEHAAVLQMLRSDEQPFDLLVPSPVLGEILAPYPHDKHSELLDALEQMPRIRIVSYDTMSALEAAQLTTKPPKRERKRSWQHIKVDIQVAACAFRNSAIGVCALDGDIPGIVKRARRTIAVGPPSTFLLQPALPMVPTLRADP